MIKKTGLRLIATSTANRTFASQIEELKTAYDALSDAEKLGAIILLDNDICSNNSYLGVFTYFVAHSGGIIARTLNMYTSKYYLVSGTSISATDRSSNTNANALRLYA